MTKELETDSVTGALNREGFVHKAENIIKIILTKILHFYILISRSLRRLMIYMVMQQEIRYYIRLLIFYRFLF